MNKNQIISAKILLKIASGMKPMDAIKEVLGAENVEKMISEIYDELRERHGKAA